MKNNNDIFDFGRIKAGKKCPYVNMCGIYKHTACNGEGCPFKDGGVSNVNFSCAIARYFLLVENNK